MVPEIRGRWTFLVKSDKVSWLAGDIIGWQLDQTSNILHIIGGLFHVAGVHLTAGIKVFGREISRKPLCIGCSCSFLAGAEPRITFFGGLEHWGGSKQLQDSKWVPVCPGNRKIENRNRKLYYYHCI